MSAVRAPQIWEKPDPRSWRRQRWIALATDEAEAATEAGEEMVARAFLAVRAAIAIVDRPLPASPIRFTCFERDELRRQAEELAREGLSGAEVARILGEPYPTVYRWLKAVDLIDPARSRLGPAARDPEQRREVARRAVAVCEELRLGELEAVG